MKFKKRFSIVLMTLLCFNTFGVKALADDVQKENIAYEQGIKSGNTQQENNLTKEAVNQKFGEVINQILSPSVYASAAVAPGKTQAAAMSLTGKEKKTYNKADLRLLATIIYCEARGESYAGKLAVGVVVMNRKSSSKFPGTVKKVIYQKNQFQPTRNGALKKALARYDSGKFKSSTEKQCIKAAKEALDGTKKVTYKSKKVNLKGYYFFSRYLKGCRVKIGNHQFK